MKLTQNQEAAIRQWAKDGQSLSEIQSSLNNWIAPQSLTYMEVRFLLDDLGIEIQKSSISSQNLPLTDEKESTKIAEASMQVPLGKVEVTINPIQRPGMLATGDVTFSDGEKAEWYFDEIGRLGLMPATTGYRPSQEDGIEFQKNLRQLLGG